MTDVRLVHMPPAEATLAPVSSPSLGGAEIDGFSKHYTLGPPFYYSDEFPGIMWPTPYGFEAGEFGGYEFRPVDAPWDPGGVVGPGWKGLIARGGIPAFTVTAAEPVTVALTTTVTVSGFRDTLSPSAWCSFTHVPSDRFGARDITQSTDWAWCKSFDEGFIEISSSTQMVTSFPEGVEELPYTSPPPLMADSSRSFKIAHPSIGIEGWDPTRGNVDVYVETTVTVAAWTTGGCYRKTLPRPT